MDLKGKKILEINHEDISASAIMFYESPKIVSLVESLNQNGKVDIKEKEKFEEGELPQVDKVICEA